VNHLSLRTGTSRPDYKTDYIQAGRSWTPLDDPMSKSGESRAIWTALDDSGQRAAYSKTAGWFDSCPTCPLQTLNLWGCWPVPPTQCACVDPNFRPLGASPQVCERCPLGDGLPGVAASSSCLRSANHNLVIFLVICVPMVGNRSMLSTRVMMKRTLSQAKDSSLRNEGKRCPFGHQIRMLTL
jgi:hypothetical protein